MLDKARRLLKKYYGYSAFREGQEKIITDILQGGDTLGIMPTGGGKSICFQIPALLFPGTALVISPLISLMKDQVDSLHNLGISAAFINSSLGAQEVRQRISAVRGGQYKLLYVAPERLENAQFRALLNSLPVSLLAVDEAHCVSQWGHDFRPSYLAIAELIRELPKRPPVAAFTATATESVIKDITKHLNLLNPSIHLTGFDRKNLTFAVHKGENKRDFLLRYLGQNADRAGIIYAATRKEVDSLCEFLSKKGFSVGRYHAGLSDSERVKAQEEFLYDDIRVMVATNAFGMGIDKSNVRFVIHYNMPKNMESYYQEAGRAGRDGEPGDCILLFSPQDIQIQKFLIEQAASPRKAAEYQKLQSMVDYCHTPRCLRKYILEYFGEQRAAEVCNNCSNCNSKRELKDITLIAQKIFSCIKRMREFYGITMVAEVLKGSGSKKVQQYKFNTLSTYGLLKEYTLKEITDLLKLLAAEDYIQLAGGQYPVAKLRPKAIAVMKNEEKVYQSIVITGKNDTVVKGPFELLRNLRKEISQQDRVPPYVIFPDSTLREMSNRLPLDEQSLLLIAGVGETKLKRYGQRFLQVIRDYCREHGITIDPAEVPVASNQGAPGGRDSGTGRIANEVPSHVLSYNLYLAGKSLGEIARERELTRVTVENHLVRCSTEGLKVDWDCFIPVGSEERILTAINALGAKKLKPLKEALPAEIDYLAIRAVICKHGLAVETGEP